jgi:hypothetical protein
MNVEIGNETRIFLFWEYFVFAVYEQLLLTAVKYCTHHAPPPFLLQLGRVKCRTGPALEPLAYLVAIAVPG